MDWKSKCFECQYIGYHWEFESGATNESVNFIEDYNCPKCGSDNIDDVKV